MLAHRAACTRIASHTRGCRFLRSSTGAGGSTTSRSTASSSTASSNTASSAGAAPATPAKGTKTWLSNMVLTYGKVGVATYAGVWLSTISAFFMALQTDALAAGDALQATRRVANAVDSDMLRSLATSADDALRAVPSSAGNLAVAFVLTKLCKPLRIATTAALTPRMARLWNTVKLRS
jgi:hypothetical protein